MKHVFTLLAFIHIAAFPLAAEINGTIASNDGLFPIGFYEHPEEDGVLKAMANAGINIVRCNTREDLDRAHAAGMRGWVSLPLHAGATDDLRKQIEDVADHPALAVWEGPDEVIWNFTAFSGLHKSMGVHEHAEEWWQQTPRAVEYSESEAVKIIPNMRASVELIRSIDTKSRPVWMNEALRSDVKFVRQYLPFIDIVGCDIYPVKRDDRSVQRMAGATDRWMQIAKGKPVWMVMQAFSWDELGEDYVDRGTAYPSFAESRFMAYDVIAHGARGLMYWGSQYTKSEEFRNSLYALTAELAALNEFLITSNAPDVKLRLIELTEELSGNGVHMIARRAGDDWLIALVNEDDVSRMGVEISGLSALEGREFVLLYGGEKAQVFTGELIVRLQPKEVKVFCTSMAYETSRQEGREYSGK